MTPNDFNCPLRHIDDHQESFEIIWSHLSHEATKLTMQTIEFQRSASFFLQDLGHSAFWQFFKNWLIGWIGHALLVQPSKKQWLNSDLYQTEPKDRKYNSERNLMYTHIINLTQVSVIQMIWQKKFQDIMIRVSVTLVVEF